MSENYNESAKQDCGCADGNCKPKKKNYLSKIIFAVILMAALAIIGVKLINRSDAASEKQSVALPGKEAGCDTSKSANCDTTKGSSCCSKK